MSLEAQQNIEFQNSTTSGRGMAVVGRSGEGLASQ
jgi:hypothetical protein